jgi:hypothetical protein
MRANSPYEELQLGRMQANKFTPVTSMPTFTLLQAMRESERQGTTNKTRVSKQATDSFGAIIPIEATNEQLWRTL